MASFFHYAVAHKRYFNAHGQRVVYKKGSYLVRPEDPSPWVYFLEEGFVKASFTFASGDERLIGFFAPGTTFAQSGSFYQDEGGGLEYIAVRETIVYRIPREQFLTQLTKDVAFSADYMQILLKNQLFLIDRLVYQGEGNMTKRLARWLLAMVKYYGEPSTDDTCMIGIPLTQDTIASFLHVTRESVSKTMSALVRKKIIRIERKHIIINDIPALRTLLEG